MGERRRVRSHRHVRNGGRPAATRAGTGNADIIAAQIQQFLDDRRHRDRARHPLRRLEPGPLHPPELHAQQRLHRREERDRSASSRSPGVPTARTSPTRSIRRRHHELHREPRRLRRRGREPSSARTTCTRTTARRRYFAGINNPVSGVNVYSTGGSSGSTCYGVTIFGACIGITGPTLGGLGLRLGYATTRRSSPAHALPERPTTRALPQQLLRRLHLLHGLAGARQHVRLRREAGPQPEPPPVQQPRRRGPEHRRAATAGSPTAVSSPRRWPRPDRRVRLRHSTRSRQADSRGSGRGRLDGGCQPAQLGNGNCDWDCVALYGHDAALTWAGHGGPPARSRPGARRRLPTARTRTTRRTRTTA